MTSAYNQSRVFVDQLGRSVSVPYPPKRIISLVPSQTELLFDLGLDTSVVGITKFCIHPSHWRQTKAIIGGTKKFDLDIIKGLNPDLIIGNKEENYQEGISELERLYPVWMSDIYNLTDALTMIKQVGELTGTSEQANSIANKIDNKFKSLNEISKPFKVLYFIWRKPWMIAADNTFINDMITRSGLMNAAGDLTRYPEIDEVTSRDINPDVILLSSEPYPFAEKHIEELKTICPDAAIKLVDGEMFSWYGSRLLRSPDYLDGLIRELTLP